MPRVYGMHISDTIYYFTENYLKIKPLPEIVFAFEFKDICNFKSLVETIMEIALKKNSHISENDVETIIEKNIRDILLVLDGWDEYTKLKYTAGNAPEMEAIIHREARKNINLLVTTRSWRSDELLNVKRFSFKKVSLAPFELPKDRDAFIKKFFPGRKHANELITALDSDDVAAVSYTHLTLPTNR